MKVSWLAQGHDLLARGSQPLVSNQHPTGPHNTGGWFTTPTLNRLHFTGPYDVNRLQKSKDLETPILSHLQNQSEIKLYLFTGMRLFVRLGEQVFIIKVNREERIKNWNAHPASGPLNVAESASAALLLLAGTLAQTSDCVTDEPH